MTKPDTPDTVNSRNGEPPGAGSPLTLDAFLPYRLSVLSNRISGMIARDYADRFGLSIPQWRVIVILAERGAMGATGVAEATQMDKVAVSRAVKTLIDRGFVLRLADQTDGRVSIVKLTDIGADLFAQVAPLAAERERQVLAGLSGEQHRQLMGIIDALDARMTELDTP